MQMKPEVFFYEVNECRHLFRFQRLSVNPLQHFEHISRTQEREMMPTLELDVNPAWHGQNFAKRPQLRVGAQSWRNEVSDDLRIERISGQTKTCVTYDALRNSISSTNSRADMN